MKSIKFKMLVMMISITIIPIIILSTFIYVRTDSMLEKTNTTSINQTKEEITYYLDKQLESALNIAQIYSQDEEIREVFLKKDRKKLLERTKEIFNSLKSSAGISIFEFGDKSGKVFLRAHNPEKYGDDKSENFDISEALKGNITNGFTYGSSGLGARAYTPLKNSEEEIIGTLQVGINLNEEILNDMGQHVAGEIAFYNEDVLTITSDEEQQDKLGTYKESLAFEEVKKSGSYQNVTDDNIFELFMPVYDSTNTEVTGMVAVYQDISQKNILIRNIVLSSLIFIIVLIIIVSLIALAFSNNFTLPIKKMTDINRKLAKGDFSINTEDKIEKYLSRKDEIGIMSRSIQEMVVNINSLINEISESATNVAASSEELTATSNQVAMASDEVAKTIEEIAGGAMDQAKETTEGAEEINVLGTIITTEIELVEMLNNSANTVDVLKEEGFTVLKDLEEKTTENNNAAKEVQEIIIDTNANADKIEAASDMIKGIAEQTNLLALNASIEAARAGEAGRGFAVVADEIRKLAEETNQFAGEISQTIAELSRMTSKGVKTMDKASIIVGAQMTSLDDTHNKFEGISEAIEEVKKIVNELNESTENMLEKKTQIINVIENLSAISEENAAGTEEAAASVEEQTASMAQISEASEELSKLAEDMQQSISRFKI